MKKTLAILLSFVMLFSVAASCLSTVAYAADAANTISITSGADFQKIGKDSAFPLSGNYVLANDITITDTAYAPIGDYTNRFTGTFDGNNKKITVDLTVTDTEVEGYNTLALASYVGLFGAVDGATIKNLTVTGTMKVTVVSGLIGGIVGGSYGATTITSVVSDVDMDIDLVAGNSGATDFGSHIGGVLGRASSNNSTTVAVTLTDVVNKGDMDITNGNTGTTIGGDADYACGGRGGLGGIVGTSAEYVAITLDHCVNYGDITIDYGTHNTGGILGAGAYTSTKGKSITMTWCANHGNLTRTTQKYDRVCGLLGAGRVKVSMEYCLNTGEISDKNPGFIGFFGSGDNYAKYCVNTAALKYFFEKYADTGRTNQSKCGYNATVSDATTVPAGSGTVLAVSSTSPLNAIYEALVQNYKGTDLEGKLKMGAIDGEAAIYFDFENPEDYEVPAVEIDSAEEFAKIGKDAEYPLSGNYRLTADIETGNVMIGSKAAPFTGSFDGNGKTVKVAIDYTNLSTTNTLDGCAYVGLFACVQDAYITDLKVTGTVNVSTVCGYIGALIGGSYGNTAVIGCETDTVMDIKLDGIVDESLKEYITDTEKTKACDYPSFIGGTVGGFLQIGDTANDAATIQNCINRGTITVATAANGTKSANAEYNGAGNGGYGGLVGITGYLGSYELALTMTDCINYADMTVNQGAQNIGGVIGMTCCVDQAQLTMLRCANFGDFTRTTGYSDRIGGLFGYVRHGVVDYCFNAGTLTDTIKTALLGFIGSKGSLIANNCFSTTKVSTFYANESRATASTTNYPLSDSTGYAGSTALSVASTDGAVAVINAIYAAMSDEAKAVFTVYGIADAQGNGATIAFAEEKPTGITAMGYQVTDVDATAGTYNIRFASIIDSLRYNAVGYEIVATYVENGETKTLTFDKQCNTVYTALTGSVNGTTAEYTVVGDYYIVALAITGVPAGVGEVTYTVKPYTVTGEAKTYGEAVTVTYAPAN